jgi:two-component system, LytTR family, sensor kinase
MKMKLPEYNGKDNFVMVIIVPLFALLFNLVNFQQQYFADVFHFIVFTIISMLGFAIYFIACGSIAVFLKKRFPTQKDLFKRLLMTIFVFLLNTGLFLYAFLHVYEYFLWFNYQFNEQGFLWNYFALGIINIFLTFLMEGIDQYNNWKINIAETEKLNAAYKQSQLNGLKSQVNPHFLFNSLNSLSSLIEEDEEKADFFLDEMSKVYRYMLRNDDEQMVTLETELKFISSYLHLLKARYGEGLQLNINSTIAYKNKLLPPLTLQVIVENAFTQNIVSKSSPLIIEINATTNDVIVVKNNSQLKAITSAVDFETGLDNLVKKYELLGIPLHVDDSSRTYRIITIPLLTKKEEVLL